MATSISLVNPEVRYNPFTGIPELERQKSGIPRAEVIFSKRDATWSSAGAGNNRTLLAAMNLDTSSNFGYVLMDCFAGFYDSTPLFMSAVAAVDIYPGGDVFSGDRIPTQLLSEPDRADSSSSTAIGDVQYRNYNSAFNDISTAYSMVFRLKGLTERFQKIIFGDRFLSIVVRFVERQICPLFFFIQVTSAWNLLPAIKCFL